MAGVWENFSILFGDLKRSNIFLYSEGSKVTEIDRPMYIGDFSNLSKNVDVHKGACFSNGELKPYRDRFLPYDSLCKVHSESDHIVFKHYAHV